MNKIEKYLYNPFHCNNLRINREVRKNKIPCKVIKIKHNNHVELKEVLTKIINMLQINVNISTCGFYEKDFILYDIMCSEKSVLFLKHLKLFYDYEVEYKKLTKESVKNE